MDKLVRLIERYKEIGKREWNEDTLEHRKQSHRNLNELRDVGNDIVKEVLKLYDSGLIKEEHNGS